MAGALEKMLRGPKGPPEYSDQPREPRPRQPVSFQRDVRPASRPTPEHEVHHVETDDPEGFRARLYAALKERAGGVPRPRSPRLPSPEQQAMYKEMRALEDYRRASRVTYGPGGVGGSKGTPMTQRVAEQQSEQAKDILSNYEAKKRVAGASQASRELPEDPHDVAQTPFPHPMTYDEQMANERGHTAAHAAMVARLQKLTSAENAPDMSRHAVGPHQTNTATGPSPEASVAQQEAESPDEVTKARAPESAEFKRPKRRDYAD